MEILRPRIFYEREKELAEIERHTQILANISSSPEEKKQSQDWMKRKLVEYGKAQISHLGFEQKAFLEEFRDKLLTVLADLADDKNKLS